MSLTINSATNRVANFSYDANGNVTNDQIRSYTYDVENRLEANELGQKYSYGPDNRRVFDGMSYTFWSPQGQRLGRYTVQVAWNPAGYYYLAVTTQETKLYFGGKLIGQSNTAPGVIFTPILTDRLGSVWVRGTATRRYFPYGEEQVVTGNPAEKFGTYLRDTNGLDYADQRYYASRVGRFMTPDPEHAGGSATEAPSLMVYE
jgi:RHS repeat-associated protein